MVSAHRCPSGRGLVLYYASFIDRNTRSVLVKREDSVTTFPQIRSGEIPHRGKNMCDCFSAQLEELIGTKYELVFLHSTINTTYRRHLPAVHFALFECVAPFDAQLDRVRNPARSEYRWVSVDQIFDPDDTVLRSMDGPNNYAWQKAYTSFAGAIEERGVRPWETSGWLSETREDIVNVLNTMDYTVTGTFEQHQISSTAAVLRIPTNRGRLYLKASHKREGLTMKCVAKFASFLVPSPLYVDTDVELMLMTDYGSTLADRFSRADYDKILILHGKLQLASLDYVDKLVEIGLPRTDFEMLKEKAKELLEDDGVDKSLREKGGVTDIRPYHDALNILLHKLYVDLDLPLAIVHPDIYDDNIIKTQKKGMEYVVYDWGSARIDIPFTDVIDLKFEVCDEERSSLGIEPYLELWAQYGSVEYLKKVCSALYAKEILMGLVELHECAKERDSSVKTAQSSITWRNSTTLPEISRQFRDLFSSANAEYRSMEGQSAPYGPAH